MTSIEWITDDFQSTTKCSKITKNGRKCINRAIAKINDEYICTIHSSSNVREEYRKYLDKVKQLREKEQCVIDNTIETNIIKIYNSLSEFRRIPPPENLSRKFLRKIQNDQCFMCKCRGEKKPQKREKLVEDHCHETGLIRSLLCKPCNTAEGMSGFSRPWNIYREYYPAKGWYHRYIHWSQKSLDHDPIQNRIQLPENIVELDDYIKYIKHLPDTTIDKYIDTYILLEYSLLDNLKNNNVLEYSYIKDTYFTKTLVKIIHLSINTNLEALYCLKSELSFYAISDSMKNKSKENRLIIFAMRCVKCAYPFIYDFLQNEDNFLLLNLDKICFVANEKLLSRFDNTKKLPKISKIKWKKVIWCADSNNKNLQKSLIKVSELLVLLQSYILEHNLEDEFSNIIQTK